MEDKSHNSREFLSFIDLSTFLYIHSLIISNTK